jgi:predicted CoA-binding protein
MATKEQEIKEFFRQPSFALVGASSDSKRFGNIVYRTLKSKSLHVLPVNPKYKEIDGDTCYPDLMSLPEKPEAAIIVTSKTNTDKVVADIIKTGVKHVWIQQGSDTEKAKEIARMNNIQLITNKCIIMHAEPATGFHKFHRSLSKLFGTLYK